MRILDLSPAVHSSRHPLPPSKAIPLKHHSIQQTHPLTASLWWLFGLGLQSRGRKICSSADCEGPEFIGCSKSDALMSVCSTMIKGVALTCLMLLFSGSKTN